MKKNIQKKWREGVGIEPTAAFTQKPPIRVEACGAHQGHIPPPNFCSVQFYNKNIKKTLKG